MPKSEDVIYCGDPTDACGGNAVVAHVGKSCEACKAKREAEIQVTWEGKEAENK